MVQLSAETTNSQAGPPLVALVSSAGAGGGRVGLPDAGADADAHADTGACNQECDHRLDERGGPAGGFAGHPRCPTNEGARN